MSSYSHCIIPGPIRIIGEGGDLGKFIVPFLVQSGTLTDSVKLCVI